MENNENKINYIQQVNGFWAKAESDDLTGNDIAVYFAILKYCNSLNWLNPFVCHWHIICQYSKVSKNTYYKSVERLSNNGYIDFRKGQRKKEMPKVTVLKFENKTGTIKEQNGNKTGTEREQKGNIYKLLNLQTIKLINDNHEIVNKHLKKWIEKEKSKPLKKTEKVFSDDVMDCYYNCIQYFTEDLIPKPDGTCEEANRQSWIDTIDKLQRIDKLSFADIEHIIMKAREDSFWKKNFLTIPKLRTKNDERVPLWKRFVHKFKQSNNQKFNYDEIDKIKERYPDA